VDEALDVTSNIRQVSEVIVEKKKPWISDETLLICDHWRKIKAKLNSDSSLKSVYNQLTSRLQQSMKNRRKRWTEQQCAELENASKCNDIHTIYSKVKQLKKGWDSKCIHRKSKATIAFNSCF
jgi:hypothetical protein